MLNALVEASRPSRANFHLAILSLTNAVIIAGLYYSQSILAVLWAEYAGNSAVALVPAATLAGYGVGVLGLTFLRSQVIARATMISHLALLIIALCSAASVRDLTSLIVSHFLLGVGATFVVRTTALTTWIVPMHQRVLALGIAVAGGLTGLAAARAGAEALSEALGGWRMSYLVGAVAMMFLGAASIRLVYFITEPVQREPDRLSILWRTCPSLRAAAKQQAASFAGFNAAWAAFLLHASSSADRPDHQIVFLVSATGAFAAILAGWLCQHLDPQRLAQSGIILAFLSAIACSLEIRSGNSPWVWMLLLDVGTQIALVANQSRAQSSAPAARNRLNALVTAAGFAGGASGSLVGQLLAHHVSLQGAFLFAAAAGSLGVITGRVPRQAS